MTTVPTGPVPSPARAWSAGVFGVAIGLIYLGFSPLTIGGMGYAQEHVAAAGALADRVLLMFGGGTPAPLVIPRHGLIEPVLQLPFVLMTRLVFGSSVLAMDRVMALEPIVLSALLCTIVFAWTRRLTDSGAWALVLGLLTAFTTMIWPYAYIGLETTQSLCLLLAAWLAVGPGRDRRPTWFHTIALAVTCGIAVSVKQSGLNLVPAVALIAGAYWMRQWQHAREVRAAGFLAQTVMTVLIVGGIYLVNTHFRNLSPLSASAGGFWDALRRYQNESPFSVPLNAAGLLLSPNKGVFIYSPILFVAAASWPRAWRADPVLALFGLLALAGPLFGSSLLVFWSDETWSSRFLHAGVAPLLVCLAASRQQTPWRARAEWPLLGFGALGAAISLLGVLFYYGAPHLAATGAGENTLEALQYDVIWNPVRFDAVLLSGWLSGKPARGIAMPWPPSRHRWFPEPGQPMAERAARRVDLRPYARPQPYLFREQIPWRDRWRQTCLVSLAAGAGLIGALAIGLRRRGEATAPPIRLPA
jgi:hypothetical protein